jgi:site-specific DNA-adenine methylase
MNKNKKTYTSAPLPFQGQKRRHVREFARIIKEAKPHLVIDLFGGSGLLAHAAKRAYPQARVVYNDYDNYRARLAQVAKTNEQLCHLRRILREHTRSKRIAGSLRSDVLQYLKAENDRGDVDWLTLSSSLRFGMKYAKDFEEFSKGSLFNRIKKDGYTVDGYLDGLEVVQADYRQLCEQYRNVPDVLFIADPPYLSTDTSTYTSEGYWHVNDYLNVLTALNGLRFIYFTSNKSQIIELCEWIDSKGGEVRNVFQNAVASKVFSSIRGDIGYTDIMLFKNEIK